MLSQSLKKDFHVSGMLFSGLGINQDVINTYHNKLIQIWSKESIHEIHKRRWCNHHPNDITKNSK